MENMIIQQRQSPKFRIRSKWHYANIFIIINLINIIQYGFLLCANSWNKFQIIMIFLLYFNKYVYFVLLLRDKMIERIFIL